MTTTADQLRAAAAEQAEWRIQHPKTGAFCWVGQTEEAARAFLDDHLLNYAGSPLTEFEVISHPTRMTHLLNRAATELETAERRYRLLSQITPGQLAEIRKRALSGELTFDQAVDEAAAWIGAPAQAEQITRVTPQRISISDDDLCTGCANAHHLIEHGVTECSRDRFPGAEIDADGNITGCDSFDGGKQ